MTARGREAYTVCVRGTGDGVRTGESRWPMAVAVVIAGLLRAVLPSELRDGDARWLFLTVVTVLLIAIVGGDPGRIDRDLRPVRVLTGVLIGLISVVNASAAGRLVAGIINVSAFTTNARVLLASGAAIWATNVIAFGLWYWALDCGGPAARARGGVAWPAFIFPEMTNAAQHVHAGWYPKFIDYINLSFSTAMAFSPTDVSAIRPWAKLMMMAEAAISFVVGILVIARAVNILQ